MSNPTYGVIVARFQVPELHLGHTHLIREVLSQHNNVIIFLGVSGSAATDINPLSFKVRRDMIKQHFPQVIIYPIYDNPDDLVWSQDIDKHLETVLGTSVTPILYGSRNSFIPHYKGKHICVEIQAIWERSGTEIRQELLEPINSSNFRAGIIHGVLTRFPITYPTVDIAIFKDNMILLCKKPREILWRFPGGFVDPTDESLLAAAKREKSEELGDFECVNWRYIGSAKINDHRYRGSKDGIISTLFAADYSFGIPQSNDDIAECRWIERTDDLKNKVNPIHHPLLSLIGE